MDTEADPKRLKSSHRPKPPPRRSVSLTRANAGEKPHQSSTVSTELHKRRIEEGKRFAVAQAQQDGWAGNYLAFDSQFGNFLVPAIPTRAELGG